MKPIGLASQIAAIGLAIAIAVLFVQPTFAEIGELQDEIQQYADERERVTETNRVLAARVGELESIAMNDRARLATYLPRLLDEVAVLRDIEIIAQTAGVGYSEIQYNGAQVNESQEAAVSQNGNQPNAEEFSVLVDGNYDRLKDFFSLLEQNEYPLQITALDISAVDGGFLTAEATIVTYIIGSDLETE